MKIQVLTHRLSHNYGGILQAYALQRKLVLTRSDISISTSHLHPSPSYMKRFLRSVAGTLRKKTIYITASWIDRIIYSKPRNFVDKYISYTENNLDKHADLLIVGSDQVWRAAYVDPTKYMFGDIKDDSIKRISYAASFGKDDINEYTSAQIEKTKVLAKKFSGISVREESGIGICKKYWGVNAECHVDPTLLLNSEEYSRIIDDEATEEPAGNLFVYVLDRSEANNKIINKVEKITNTKRFEVMPKEYNSFVDFLRNKKPYMMRTVEQWLRSFRDAEFVVTDSFHGTVFSIVFNKPFITIGNQRRGMARFASLLGTFKLEDRLVLAVSEITPELINRKIDWERVNTIKQKEQQRSHDFLMKHLNAANGDKRRVA